MREVEQRRWLRAEGRNAVGETRLAGRRARGPDPRPSRGEGRVSRSRQFTRLSKQSLHVQMLLSTSGCHKYWETGNQGRPTYTFRHFPTVSSVTRQ